MSAINSERGSLKLSASPLPSSRYPYTAELIGASFKTSPFDHQMREFECAAEAPARAMAWTMRTGKSKTIIDRACHLYEVDKIDAVLVFAPNGVHANWIERELPAHCWESVPTSALVWRSLEAGTIRTRDPLKWDAELESWWQRLATVKTNRRLMWLAVNSESMTRPDVRKAVARFVKHRRVFVVFDESDDFGTPGAKRTKMARALAARCPFRAILSGTIITGSPLQAFSQYELLEKEALGFKTFGDFEARYAEYEKSYGAGGRSYPKLIGYKNEEELRERMARFTSVVLREDCKDMPDLVPRTRKITPTPEQLAIYRELHETFLIDVENERVNVGERAPRFQKLQQVFSGFVIDGNGVVKHIPGGNPRLDALSEEVYLSPGKVIIWCQFQADMDLAKKRLLHDGHKVVEYHGRVSGKEKLVALESFRNDPSIKPLVGHAKSGGRGLDMSVASKIFWYSHTFSARTRQQALERATKIGGKNIEVVDFEAPGPDQYIRSKIQSRIDVADAIAGAGMKAFLEGIAL